MSVTTLHEDDRGKIYADGNELFVEDKVAGGDPVALGFHSVNETIGKLSPRMRVGGSWKEVGFVNFKRDERGRTDPAHRDALEIEVWTHIPGRGFEDPDYERMFGIRHDGVVFYKGSSAGVVHQAWSPNMRFLTNWQDDGHIVQYDTADPRFATDPGAAAVWSNWHGLLRPLPW